MLKSLFYARFHPERGPSIIHQHPPNSIITSDPSSNESLFNFSNISSYIIPPYETCNRPVSICTSGYRILGFPVSLEDAKYARNRFTFNICFVLDEDVDSAPWTQIVRKTARFFQSLEEEDGVLQAEELLEALKWAGEEGYPAADVGSVYSLLETTFGELNAYGETCVRFNDLHVLNLRLVTPRPAPPKVKAWDVPLLIRPLPSPDEWTRDLTLQRISPYVDGTNHVQRIALLADVELRLVKQAIQELLYHSRATILDLFHFQAIYAPTSDFAWFVKDSKMQEECRRYVAVDPAENIFQNTPPNTAFTIPSPATLISLYRLLQPGLSVQEFCLAHEAELHNIDVRRFITFGVIKGFLRRVHRFALASDTQATPPHLRSANGSSVPGAKGSKSAGEEPALEFERAWKRAALSSGWATPPMEPVAERTTLDELEDGEGETLESGYLDGRHSLDEICLAMQMAEKSVVERLRSGRFGEVVLFCQ